MLEIIRAQDFCSLMGAALIMILVGRVFTDNRQKWWGGFLALAGFIAYGCYSLCEFPPQNGAELFNTAVCCLMVFGLVLGASWLILPIVIGIGSQAWRKLKESAAAAAEESRRARAARQAEQHHHQETEKDRLAASERTLAEARKKAEAGQKQEEKKKKGDLRASVEILFQLHQHVLASRLEKQTVMDWIARYMNDDEPLDAVTERSKEITGLIQSLIQKPEVPVVGPSADVMAARKDVETLYAQHTEIHAVCPAQRVHAEIRVRIPDGASAEEAWKGASEMMKDILDLVAQEEQKRQRLKQQTVPVNPPLGNI